MMNLKSQIIGFSFAAAILFSLNACTGDDTENKNNKKDSTKTEITEVITDETVVHFLIPSPRDMFSFTNDSKLKFSEEVLNPTVNSDQYIDTKSKEFGFGVYSADLAYAAAFKQTKATFNYLNVVRDLSDKIQISTVFDKSMINRMDNIAENKDSLVKVTNDTYFDIVRYLEDDQRTSSLALISAGGWLESLFIVTSLVDEYSADNPTIQLVADQKDIFQNLFDYLKQNESDENIKSIMTDFMPIKDIYDELVRVESTDKVSSNSKGGVVLGGKKIELSAEQYMKLKTTIADVRNKLTGNKS